MRYNVSDHIKPYVDRAELLEKSEQYDAAESIYREALELYPHNPVLHNNLGCCLANQEKYEEAKLEFLQAVTLSIGASGELVPDTYPEEPKANLLAAQAQLDKGVGSLFSRLWRRPFRE